MPSLISRLKRLHPSPVRSSSIRSQSKTNSAQNDEPPTKGSSPLAPAGEARPAHSEGVRITRITEDDEEDLWDRAFISLRSNQQYTSLLDKYERNLLLSLNSQIKASDATRQKPVVTRQEEVARLITNKLEEIRTSKIKLTIGKREIIVHDQADRIVKALLFAKDSISAAASAEPQASLAWGGVCLLLTLLSKSHHERLALMEGLDYITDLICRYPNDTYYSLPYDERRSYDESVETYYKHHTFLDYCAQYWVDHYRNGQVSKRSDLVKLAATICDSRSPRFFSWYLPIFIQMPFMSGAPSPYEAPPLLIAARFCLASVAKFLLEGGEDPNLKGVDDGQAPLIHAVKNNDMDTASILLKYNADPSIRDVDDATPLHVAQNLRAMLMLLDAGASVHVKDCLGKTPLHEAVNNEDMLKVILEHGADVNARDEDGCTALAMAAESGLLNAVRALLDAGADPQCQSNSGLNPLHYAAINFSERAETSNLSAEGKDAAPSKDWAGVIKLLITRGTDVSATTKMGKTPAEMLPSGRKESRSMLEAAMPRERELGKPDTRTGSFFEKLKKLSDIRSRKTNEGIET